MATEARTGIGYDIHPIAAGRPLYLGGIYLPGEPGLAGHSDADVLLHALMDALLGAAGLGDIGHHFPPTDPRYKDVRSTELMRTVMRLLRANRWQVGNVDVTVIAERPKLAPYIPQMRALLAVELGIEPEQVNIKATTPEGLGALGRGEGIAALAVATITR